MLTIRHVEPNGYESIIQVHDVWRDPEDRSIYAGLGEGKTPTHFATGAVYVMNDSGNTVAVYHLPYPAPTPLAAGEAQRAA